MKTNKIFLNKFTKNHEDNKEEYYKHLSNISGLVNDFLFRFFSYDLFADGRLISFDYSFLKKQIVMIIDCPNVLNKNNQYIEIPFKITFGKVSWFSIDMQNCSDVSLENSIYRKSEICTLVPLREGLSIAIEFWPNVKADSAFLFSAVFREFQCHPLERLSFLQLERAGELRLASSDEM